MDNKNYQNRRKDDDRITELTSAVCILQKQMNEIHDLFTKASGVITFVKWGAAVVAAAAAAYVWLYEHITITHR